MYLSAGGRCARCGEPLGEYWDGHHINPFANGGVTEITNGTALCERCHVLVHRRVGMIKPRGWQVNALENFQDHDGLSFLVEATPGAGKTIFSALCAAYLIQMKLIDFVLIAVPTTALKGDKDAGFLGDWSKVGIQITTVLKDGRGAPSDFKGAVVTYQQLPNLVATIEQWHGLRILLVLDEVHHLSENIWGSAAERIACVCTKVLAMTGTPFRGDGRRISFVEYDESGKAKPDSKYTYEQAVTAGDCRPVDFITDDGIAEFLRAEEEVARRVRLSDELDNEDLSDATRTTFSGDSTWLRTVIEKADTALDEYRSWDPDAAMLIVCRPGTDERDNRHLDMVAKMVRQITGEQPEVIYYEDRDADAKIERFRKGTQRCICAVRKISEGVDIKRLRVQVMANRPTTELLFRQLVGRVVRVDNVKRPGDARVFIAKFKQLTEWAMKIREEAESGLKKKQTTGGGDGIGDDPRDMRKVTPIGTSHEDGGAISDFGERFTAAEINAAERDKTQDPQLIGIAVTTYAYIRRKLGIKTEETETAQAPLHTQKKELRTKINKAVGALANQRNPAQPDYKGVWVALHRATGASSIDDLMDNYSIDVMRQAQTLLTTWMSEKYDAA